MTDVLNEPIKIDNPAVDDAIRIAVLIDESGSMISAAQDTIKNLNSYIDEQASSDKKTLLSVYTFNGNKGVTDRYVSVDAKSASHMSLYGTILAEGTLDQKLIYSPSGGTPLYDAIATVIMKETSDIPTLVVLLTDGGENASIEYRSLSNVQALIKQKEEAGWSFVFLMAGLDRHQSEQYTSRLMGRSYAGSTMNYSKGLEGVAFGNLASASATWGDYAREQKTSGGTIDTVAYSQGFFDSSVRELKTEDKKPTKEVPPKAK